MLIFNGKKYFVPIFTGTGGDVLGADALPYQVVEGVKFVGANGVVETGELPYYDYANMQAEVLKGEDGKLYIKSFVIKPSVMEDEVYSTVSLDQLGNANPYYVAEGHTITSEFGVHIGGTAKIYDYEPIEANCEGENDTDYIFMGYVEGNTFMEDEVRLKVPKSAFGDAQPNDVRKGKKYTSLEGVGEEGTAPDVTLSKPTIGIDRINRKISARVSQQTAGYISKGVETAEVDIPDYLVETAPITKTSDDLIVDGAEITTPAGYYPEDAKKSVQIGSVGEILAGANNATGIVNIRVSTTEGYIEHEIKTKELKLENDYLISANIKKGVTIFGVTGTMESGASIATCTVNITFSINAGNTLISATAFANGAISVVNHDFMNNNSGQSISIPNVVCGSALSINTSKMVGLYWSGSKKDHTGLFGGTITVPNTTGTYSVEIGVVDD